MWKRILLGVGSGIAAMALSAGTAAATPASSEADAAVARGVAQSVKAKQFRAAGINDAVVRYIGGKRASSSLLVCKDWGSATCATKSSREYLKKNNNTKTAFKWSDADGVYHPGRNCTLTAKWGILKKTYKKKSGTWLKLHGLNGGTWQVSVSCPK